MLNLITNAAEAMKDSDRPKKISISLSLDGNRLKISVGDSGPGVAPARRDKIFDPFYTTKSRSTGIGLSLSHRIIMDHGGGLTVGTSPWEARSSPSSSPCSKERASHDHLHDICHRR